MKTLSVIVFLVYSVLYVSGHTWLDCVNVTNPMTVTNLGDMSCNGYPRGYVGRSNPDANMWKIQGITPAQYYAYAPCRNSVPSYSGTYPMTPSMKAGDKMTIAYTPNGHTAWHNPPPPNGPRDFWVQWSGVAGQQLNTMRDVENAQTLLKVKFDTPCHSRVNGAELDSSAGICMADVVIPTGTPPGTYQLVWWWPFNFSNADIEHYTTCWDVQVVAGTNQVTPTSAPVQTTAARTTAVPATTAAPSTSPSPTDSYVYPTDGGNGGTGTGGTGDCCCCCNNGGGGGSGVINEQEQAASDDTQKAADNITAQTETLMTIVYVGIGLALIILAAGVILLFVIFKRISVWSRDASEIAFANRSRSVSN